MKRKTNYKQCSICNKSIGTTAFSRHVRSCGTAHTVIGEKDEHGKTQRWYDAMHARQGKGSNQYTKAAELGLPKPIISEETRNKLRCSSTGRKHSDETKKLLSDLAKSNHKKGVLRDIGYCIHNGIPSKSELEFIKIIEESIIDKDYVKDLQFFKYRLDFAWKKRKICVEIDGEQHNTGYQFDSDRLKDVLLLENEWKFLRIESYRLFSDKQAIIELVNNFIKNNNILPEDLQWKDKKEIYDIKYQAAINNGILDKNGKISSSKLSKQEIQTRITLIKNSNIDFSVRGWSKELAILLNFSQAYVKNFMKKYMNDFYISNCYVKTDK